MITIIIFFEINIWLAACVGGQAQELDIELEFELDIEIKLDLTNESCSSLEFLTSSLKLFVGFNWAVVGFEHVIVIVKPSLGIHYSTWFDYSLGLVEVLLIISIFFSQCFLIVWPRHFKFEVLFFVLEYFHSFLLFMFRSLFGNVSRCFVIKK